MGEALQGIFKGGARQDRRDIFVALSECNPRHRDKASQDFARDRRSLPLRPARVDGVVERRPVQIVDAGADEHCGEHAGGQPQRDPEKRRHDRMESEPVRGCGKPPRVLGGDEEHDDVLDLDNDVPCAVLQRSERLYRE
jgi:hypothetical protein